MSPVCDRAYHDKLRESRHGLWARGTIPGGIQYGADDDVYRLGHCRRCHSTLMKAAPRSLLARPGARFDALTVVLITETRRGRTCLCRCDCGQERVVKAHHLIQRRTSSCGCRNRPGGGGRVIHGESGGRGRAPTMEHRSWSSMISRCTNPRNSNFRDYGARGITVCERWRTYELFLLDVGRRPSPVHSIDRIDVNGTYEPGNVRWATRREQQRNHRRARLVAIDGVTKNVFDWAEQYGVHPETIHARSRRGLTGMDLVAPARIAWSPDRRVQK